VRCAVPQRASIENYIFVNCRGHIIAFHPANGNFAFINVANNVAANASFCVSRKYGVFYVNKAGDAIMQSHDYDANRVGTLAKSVLAKNKVRSVNYDEMFGISGRLIAICESSIRQWCNLKELEPLKQALSLQSAQQMNAPFRPFNLTVSVYEMLFGDAFVADLRQKGALCLVSSLRLKHLKDNVLGLESLSAPPIAAVRKALSQMERIAVGDVIHVLVDLGQEEEVEVALAVEDIEPVLHDASSIGAVAWSVSIKMHSLSAYEEKAAQRTHRAHQIAQLEAMEFKRNHIDSALSEYQSLYGDGPEMDMGVLMNMMVSTSENTFPSTLSPMQINELKVGDKVDHRDKVGRFLSAEVKAREGTLLLMHYEGWDPKWDEWCDFSKEVGRFAAHKSISKRPTRMQGVCKGLKVRYLCVGVGRWVDAIVVKVDEGQVQVVYQMYGQNLTRWAHLDNTEEILAVE